MDSYKASVKGGNLVDKKDIIKEIYRKLTKKAKTTEQQYL